MVWALAFTSESQIKNITKNFYSKVKIVLLFFAIFTVLLVPTVSNDAFANHLSEKMKWQLVFISSQPGCANYHYQIMNKFHFIAEEYLNLYGVEDEAYSPTCFSYTKYPQNYIKPNDLDLFVLVYDKNLGRELLQGNDVGGLYKHFGSDRTTNHIVVFCDCPSFNYSDPVWILTHELSHFSLLYLGYETSIIENLVHANDQAFDMCREDWQESCNSLVTKLNSEKLANYPSVMPVYQPDDIGNKTEFQSIEVSDEMVELSKLITQWWSSGQIIDNNEYVKAIQLLGSNQDFYIDNGNVEFADHPIKNELTWEELLYGELHFDSNIIMPYIPFKQNSEFEINDELDDRLTNVPSWFKQTALWWANGDISDEEFVQVIYYLKEQGLIDPYFDLRFLFKN